MPLRRRSKPRPLPESIDGIVAKEEMARRARATVEEQRRVDLAKRLGNRAMEGEPFGITGFMAIGFPNLTPETSDYQDIVRACADVQRIRAGKYIKVGDVGSRVVGIKADAENRGLAFNVRPQADGTYRVQANVLCARALYEHNPPDGTIYGSEEEPYPVEFIDTSISDNFRPPVREIILGSDNDAGYDQYADGSRVSTDGYTMRLRAAELVAAI